MHIIRIQDKLNEAKIKRASGSDCRGSHFDCEHFSDFSRHTPKQQHHLLRLCHLRSTSGKQRGRFCLPHCLPCFTPKRKDRQNFLSYHTWFLAFCLLQITSWHRQEIGKNSAFRLRDCGFKQSKNARRKSS